MSRAWLDRGRLHLRCDACESIGTPGGAEVATIVPDKLRAGYADFGKKLSAVVQKFQNDTTALHFNSSLTDDQKRAKHDMLRSDAKRDMDALGRDWPTRDGVRTVVTKCPWCAEPLNIEIQENRDGV